jgi:hypothetical protein
VCAVRARVFVSFTTEQRYAFDSLIMSQRKNRKNVLVWLRDDVGVYSFDVPAAMDSNAALDLIRGNLEEVMLEPRSVSNAYKEIQIGINKGAFWIVYGLYGKGLKHYTLLIAN